MSADLNTVISIQGNQEELFAVLKVLRSYETEKRDQYRTQRNCGYIDHVVVTGALGDCRIEKMIDEELMTFLSTAGEKLIITTGGPWGAFYTPSEAGLFEAMADVAPDATFRGSTEGFVTGADVSYSVELSDGLMHISECLIPNEEFPELYIKEFKEKLPYAKFCKLFKVDKEEFDKDSYEEFIDEAGNEGFPNEMDYDTFIEICYGSEIDEDKFEDAVEKVSELGIVDFDTFRDEIDMDEYAEKSIYDPKTKTYSKPGSGTKCQDLTFVITGKLNKFKNRDAFTGYVELQGGKVTGSISKNTNYLVNNDASSDSSKNKKAKEMNIPIITEAEFIEKFGC